MKRHALLTALLMGIMTVTNGANAEPNQAQEFVIELKVREARRMTEVAELLRRLHQMGALDVTEYGEVKVKNSFIEILNRQGRISVEKISESVICNSPQ